MVVSADQSGVLEYWSGMEGSYLHPNNVTFESKLETDLYEFVKVNEREIERGRYVFTGLLSVLFSIKQSLRI